MSVNAVLRELFAHKTQAQVAAELTAMGLPTHQTTVSGWRKERQPSLDQIAIIERWAGKPRGWVLARAGYATMPGVDALAVTRPADDPLAELRAQVEWLTAEVVKLQRDVGLLGGAAVRAARPATPAAQPSPGGAP